MAKKRRARPVVLTLYSFHLILVLLLCSNAWGQDLVTADEMTHFVRQELNNIHQTVHKKVMAGRSAPYTSDSLEQTYSLDELKFNMEEYSIGTPDSVFALGTVLLYDPSWDVESATAAYRLAAIAPKVALNVNGLVLNSVAYWTTYSDLVNTVSKENNEFIRAMAMVAAAMGDFSRYAQDSDPPSQKAESIRYQTFWDERAAIEIDATLDTVIGLYCHSLLTAVLHDIHFDDRISIFRDQKLNNPYESIEEIRDLLSEEMVVTIQNYLNPDDPWDLIDTIIYIPGQIGDRYNFEVHPVDGDVIIGIRFKSQQDSESFTVYYSFNAVRNRLKPFDLVILDRFFRQYQVKATGKR